MKAVDLEPGHQFTTTHTPNVFTLAKPMERDGDVLLLEVEEHPGRTMSLFFDDEVTLVPAE